MKTLAASVALSLFSVFQASSATHVVQSGENMYRIALRHNITVAALQAANPDARVGALRIGQNLVVPGKSATASSPSVTRTKAPTVSATGSHQVASGETLTSIARAHGISVSDLQVLNPSINPAALRIGQSIKVSGNAIHRKASSQVASRAKPPVAKQQTELAIIQKSQPEPKEEFLPEPKPTTSVVAVEYTLPSPAPVIESTISEMLEPTTTPVIHQYANSTVKEAPKGDLPKLGDIAAVGIAAAPGDHKFKLIKTTREQTLADFAKEHDLTTEQLNSINGWNFPPSTLLAVDSELYIPAQP